MCGSSNTRSNEPSFLAPRSGITASRAATGDLTAEAGIDRRKHAESARPRTGAHSASARPIQRQPAAGCCGAEYQHRHAVAEDEGVRVGRLSLMAWNLPSMIGHEGNRIHVASSVRSIFLTARGEPSARQRSWRRCMTPSCVSFTSVRAAHDAGQDAESLIASLFALSRTATGTPSRQRGCWPTEIPVMKSCNTHD